MLSEYAAEERSKHMEQLFNGYNEFTLNFKVDKGIELNREELDIFNTKFVKDNERNGQKCWITEVTHVARNSQQDLVIVRFEDGYTTECYRNELL